MYRPPVGFIVEGHGEYNCYPSLVSKALGCGVHAPIMNAGGCGNLIKNLEEHLDLFFIADSPYKLIITVDLQDVLDQKWAGSCGEFLEDVKERIDKWRDKAKLDGRLLPIPENIICIVQIRKFETWLMSDISGLREADLLINTVEEIADVEVIPNPQRWLEENLKIGGDVKRPTIAKKIVAAMDVYRMVKCSRSFDKFCREC